MCQFDMIFFTEKTKFVMSLNRLQKLLFSEYCDFEDMILVESPFAQTTNDGTGIRQVHLGLTPSKLVIATDVLPQIDDIFNINNIIYIPGIDPDIETFELIAIYPIECVNLSVYRRRKRQTLKAHFCNNKVLYFELGGIEKRTMFWNLWCERVRFLNPEEANSSHSETSVGTSSTNSSTLYLIDKRVVIQNGLKQLWYKFGPTTTSNSQINGNNKTTTLIRKWSDKNLYIGKNLNDSPSNYIPIVIKPKIDQFIKPKRNHEDNIKKTVSDGDENVRKVGDVVRVNRFGDGIYEGCNTGLYLTMENYMPQETFSQFILRQTNSTPKYISSMYNFVNYEEIAENIVRKWESVTRDNLTKNSLRHKRRYGLVPCSHFLNGLGIQRPIKGSVYTIRIKRAISVIGIKCEPKNEDIWKRRLVSSISCEFLNKDIINNITSTPKSPILLFWTPNYWYQPCSAKEVYNQLQNHIKSIRNEVLNKKNKNRKRSFFKWRLLSNEKTNDSDVEENQKLLKRKTSIKSKLTSNLFDKQTENLSEIDSYAEPYEKRRPKEVTVDYQKRILQMDVILSAKDFNSTILAEQLTMLDKELWMKIDRIELENIVYEGYKKVLPNIGVCVAFLHRISCLIATEILKEPLEKIRARLIARFINVAEKCHKMSNFQTCKTVLCGLQCPAIYRLRKTWSYVRKKHATKYQMYEFLCRLYKDTRLPIYQKAYFIASQTPPYLPYIGDLFTKLLNKMPEYKIRKKRSTSISSFCANNSTSRSQLYEESINNKFFMKFLNIFTNYNNKEKNFSKEKQRDNNLLPISVNSKYSIKFNALNDYYKPLEVYEDNRQKCLIECAQFLEKSQIAAMNYNFPVNDLARNYLLKARYHEEAENFRQSLLLETNP